MKFPFSMADSEKPLLWLLAGVQFVNILDFVMMPLGPLFMADLGATPAQLGLLASSYTLAAAFAGIATAAWINRNSFRKTLLTTFGVFGAATLACGLAPNLTTLLTARVAAGAAGGPAASLVLTIISNVVPLERRGKAMAILGSAFSMASVVGVPAGLALTSFGSWRWPFFMLSVLALTLWVVIWKRLPSLPVSPTGSQSQSTLHVLISVLRNRRLRRAYVTLAFSMASGFALIPFLSPYLVNNRGVAQSDLSVFYAVGGASTLAVMQWLGRWVDRYGPFRIIAIVTVLFALNLQAVLWAPFAGTALIPSFAAFMVLSSSRFVPLLTLMSQVPPPSLRGAFLSYLDTVQHLASGMGPLFVGAFLTADSHGRLLNFTSVAEVTVLISLTVIAWVYSLVCMTREARMC